jgi:hypothetical protein
MKLAAISSSALILGAAAMVLAAPLASAAEKPAKTINYISVEKDGKIVADKTGVALAECVSKDPSKFESPALTFGKIVTGDVKGAAKPTNIVGQIAVKKDTKPGVYPIHFTCGGKVVSSTFTVLAPAGKK